MFGILEIVEIVAKTRTKPFGILEIVESVAKPRMKMAWVQRTLETSEGVKFHPTAE